MTAFSITRFALTLSSAAFLTLTANGQIRHWNELGHAQRGAAGVPQISASSVYLGQALRMNVTSVRPGSMAFFVLGIGRADVQVHGTRVVPRFDLIIPAPVDMFGCAKAVVPIPNVPQLDGLDLYLQAVAPDRFGIAASPALKGFVFAPGNPFDQIACDFSKHEPEEGPKHLAWKAKLRAELVKALKAEGFTDTEITSIANDSFRGIKGIIKNLLRLYKALRAIRKARQAAGPEPKFTD